MPTKTQVLNARPQILLDIVNGWSPFMATEEQTAHTYRGYVERPGGQPWEGDTADAAITVARDHHLAVADARDTVDAGVRALGNTIGTELIPPLTNAQQIIANADTQPGVTVNEDLSITYTPPDGMSEAAADRNRQIVADAAKELLESANSWWAAEQQVASEIATLRGTLDGTIPQPGAGGGAPPPPLTMVGPFALPPDVAAAAVKPPGQTTVGDSAPPAQIGPFAVPAAVAAAAGNLPDTAPVTTHTDDGGLGDLLGVNDPNTGAPANGQPGGLPAALSQLPPPPAPAAVARQAAKVDAARQNLDAAQAQLDDAAGQTYTRGPGAGPGRDVTNPLTQAVFDARADLTAQTRTLNELNYASAASGGPTVPAAPLPPNADVQAFPPQPSAFAEGSRALSEGSFGLIPDVAKDIDTFANWGQHSGADQLGAVLDAAGLIPIPGAKLLAEGLEHGLDALGAITRHIDDIPDAAHHADDDLFAGHGGTDVTVEHHAPEPINSSDPVPTTHQLPEPDVFNSSQGLHYPSGDAYHPGGWPPSTPEPTWTKGDTTPGWEHINRGQEKPWMDYQSQISGIERTPDGRIPEWVITNPETGVPVKFDSAPIERGDHQVVLDAKHNYTPLYKDPGAPWTANIREGLVDEAERQLDVLPPGTDLEWHVANPQSAAIIRDLLAEGGFPEVRVIFTPQKP